LVINAGSQGCFHHYGNIVEYTKLNDSIFETKDYINRELGKKDIIPYQNQMSIKLINDILNSINLNPTYIPSLKNFKITEQDKKNYLLLLDSLKSENKDNEFYRSIMGMPDIIKDSEFYYSIPEKLDNLNDSVVSNILNKKEIGSSNINNWFRIQIINQSNDTLNIGKHYSMRTLPWYLPWEIEYKGQHFVCYDISLSNYINKCIPDNFIFKDVFDNKLLIMEIAKYLHLFYQNQ
jgi:hypothetical protein